MSDTSTDFDEHATTGKTRANGWRRELLLAGGCLLVGLVLLPAAIYWAGATLLGAYGGGPHVGAFYGDFFRNLASGSLRTWIIALSPYVLLTALRLTFRPRRLPLLRNSEASEAASEPVPAAAQPRDAAQPKAKEPRREPFVSS